ncbi:hypothetical protein K239x_35930 [Planctomycetes bacterium K23_9]|uniref:Uncharacterized protein n=1 Tax=Stieleria marina TaxID=1930275 RepID=A0A517NWT4_9BACT|nr:hypothetical protein K239x_35930 [Planctomycetes bacterium K23_9]
MSKDRRIIQSLFAPGITRTKQTTLLSKLSKLRKEMREGETSSDGDCTMPIQIASHGELDFDRAAFCLSWLGIEYPTCHSKWLPKTGLNAQPARKSSASRHAKKTRCDDAGAGKPNRSASVSSMSRLLG